VPLLADAVVSDNRSGARSAVEHLLKTGCRRVAYLGDDLDIFTANERFGGYEAALAAAGLGTDRRLVRHGIRTVEQARTATAGLLENERPEGLFTSQNLVTIGALEALHGARLEHEVALIGFDDVSLGSVVEPGVSVMAQDPAQIGTLAAERLLARMDGDVSAPAVHTVATRLIARGSGELGDRARR